MNKPGYSVREILESQIKRANELYSELESEVKKDILNSRVSPRTLEITEDILTKLSNCLDKGINQYRQSKNQQTSKNLYFPICHDERDFKNKLTSYGLNNLEKTDPKLLALLHNAQQFISKESAILIELHEHGSKEKHRALSLQEKEIVGERITISNNSGHAVGWDSFSVKFGAGVKILGVPVDPKTQLPHYVPPTHSLKKERFISVKFQGKNIEVLQFCRQSINEVQKITNQIILLSEEV
jgi:hypothetical protein